MQQGKACSNEAKKCFADLVQQPEEHGQERKGNQANKDKPAKQAGACVSSTVCGFGAQSADVVHLFNRIDDAFGYLVGTGSIKGFSGDVALCHLLAKLFSVHIAAHLASIMPEYSELA
jgi:hypothetical protein